MAKNQPSKKPFRPTKGGDGGTAPGARVQFVDAIGAHANKRANARICMNCVPPDDLERRTLPTEDPFDRAHQVTIGGMLISAAAKVGRRHEANSLIASRARRYTACYMVVERRRGKPPRVVSFETALDEYESTRRRLSGIPGVGRNDSEGENGSDSVYTRTEADMAFRCRDLATLPDNSATMRMLRNTEAFDNRTREERKQDSNTNRWIKSAIKKRTEAGAR